MAFARDHEGTWHADPAATDDGWWLAACGRRILAVAEPEGEVPDGEPLCACWQDALPRTSAMSNSLAGPVRVMHLLPGDVVTLDGSPATFIAAPQHPVYLEMRLVVWKLADGTWSLEALSPFQEAGDVQRASGRERQDRVHAAFYGELPRRAGSPELPDGPPATSV